MFEELAADDLSALTEGELKARVLAIETARSWLDALDMATLAQFDARTVYAGDGATGTAAWLRHQCGTAGAQATEKVRVARRLQSMPVTTAAFEAGELSYGKVRLLAFARTDRTTEVFDRDEAVLVAAARNVGCDDVARITRHWTACADPDGVSGDTAAQWTRRKASIIQGFDSTWSLHGTLDPESGAVIAATWQTIIDEFRRTDSSDPAAPERSTPQRSADALVELARRAGARHPGTSRPNRPEMMVILDYDTLIADTGGHGELADGTILSGDSVRRLACDASIRRVVTTGESEILDLGRSTPTPNSAQRRALELRDGGCIWPGCDRPPTWCDAHHLVPYQRGSPHGGLTDLDGLALICRQHHHLVHDDHFTIARDPVTAIITVTRPDGTIASTTTATGPLTRPRATTRSTEPKRKRPQPPRLFTTNENDTSTTDGHQDPSEAA